MKTMSFDWVEFAKSLMIFAAWLLLLPLLLVLLGVILIGGGPGGYNQLK